VLVMLWMRLGSLNALEETCGRRFWQRWLHGQMPSADTVGRVFGLMAPEGIREGLSEVYRHLKRNKALGSLEGLNAAVLDGHETSSSDLRHCGRCLIRRVKAGEGRRIQYYHRNVTLMLLGDNREYLLDMELQRRGEDEVGTAKRLLKRVLKRYPRAFDVVLADALYAVAPFINYLWARRKYSLIVLKQECRAIYKDALGLMQTMEARVGEYRGRRCAWWDVGELGSWDEVKMKMRVVRSEEHWEVRRQTSKQLDPQRSEWMWVTNLPTTLASSQAVVRLGHRRWDIENQGFNELVNGWHTSHVYRHDPVAIEAFYLAAFLAYNLFQAFWSRNLKPQLRWGKTQAYIARLLAGEVYQDALWLAPCRAP
jgi:hypothetical protein